MEPQCLCFVIFFTIQVSQGEVFNPYSRGPHEHLFHRYTLNETGLDKTVDVWAPVESGSHPVIIYTGSFAAVLPANGVVQTFLERIASWGFAIMAPWKSSSPDCHTNFIDPVLEHLESRMENDWIASGAATNFSLNFTRMILMGHSAGNHINVNYLKNQCGRFIAAILLSPVDGVDPYGIVDDFCTTPGEKLNFSIPTLTLQAGLDPVKGTILYPACAPEKLSNKRFYDAMVGDRWFVNASAYGHADLLEKEFLGAVEFIRFCATDSKTDKEIYRDFVAGTVVSFSKAMLNPEEYCDILTYVEEPLNMTVDAIAEHDAPKRCQPSECQFSVSSKKV